jgi:hypothetical protein
MIDNEKNDMSISDCEDEIYQKLVEAEASSNPRRLSHEEVFSPLRRKIAGYIDSSKILGVKYHHAH